MQKAASSSPLKVSIRAVHCRHLINKPRIKLLEFASLESEKGFSFTKADRLLHSSEFTAVFDDAPFRASHPQFLILSRLNTLDHPRLGLVIAKKNVSRAVNRNRLKRLIRESFRGKQHHLPAIDAIVLARRGTENLNNYEIDKILNDLWKRVAKKATTADNVRAD